MITSFPAKLLLFGEHTVLKGSRALAIPFPAFSGHWSFCRPNMERASLQMRLPQLLMYLKSLKQAIRLLAPLDLARFEDELDKGLYFESNIPSGYGLGSSGALCAALYHRYVDTPERKNLPALKKALAQIESFFHGSSSGADPLIILLQQPVLIDHQGNITTTSIIPSENPSGFVYFLLDTGISRKTGPFVNLFLEKCEDPAYLQAIQSQLSLFTDHAIQSLLEGLDHKVFEHLDQISSFQWVHFREMIPSSVFEVWENGLSEQSPYKLKLCGAGGGGFLLGMAKKDSPILNELGERYKITSIQIRK